MSISALVMLALLGLALVVAGHRLNISREARKAAKKEFRKRHLTGEIEVLANTGYYIIKIVHEDGEGSVFTQDMHRAHWSVNNGFSGGVPWSIVSNGTTHNVEQWVNDYLDDGLAAHFEKLRRARLAQKAYLHTGVK